MLQGGDLWREYKLLLEMIYKNKKALRKTLASSYANGPEQSTDEQQRIK